jgi:oligopeptidase B
MRNINYTLLALACLFLSCMQDKPKVTVEKANLQPPTAAKIVKEFSEYGTKRLDEYFWLSNPNDSNVIKQLNAENAYVTGMMRHTEGLQKKLYDEMVARVEQKAQSVPVRKNGYWYYSRYEEGKEYPLICRKKDNWTTAENVILNVPDMAKGYKLFRLFEFEASPDNTILAYCVDTTGDRRNTLYFKNLASGAILKDRITNVATNGLAWSKDGRYIYYLVNDNTVRSYKVMRHILGTDPKNDAVIFTENDNTFSLNIYPTQSKQYIVINSESTTSTESRIIDAADIKKPVKVFHPRQKDLLYNINHYEKDSFYVYNNDQAKNFKLSITPLSNSDVSNWKLVVPHSDSSFLMGYEVLKNHILIQDKTLGLNKIRVIDRQTKQMENVDFGEEVYVANMYLADDDNFDSDSIRYNYASLTTPNSVYRYDIKTKTKTVLKQDKVAGFSVSDYETKRLWVMSRDSVRIPVSVVYKKSLLKRDGSNPLYLYAYGSYGNNTEPYFSQSIISLMDRGFVYAIAHIRGGQELGRKWYEDGKLLKKKNTFNDFVDCAEYMIKEKYTQSDKLFANGGSAGGMLMGAVINQKPELWRGVIAEVPWVDVITDMYNDKLPLTTLEYDEWGNPNNKEYYDYMLSWSPYDNIKKVNYPAILATGGLNDTQVPYYNPAKWVQRVRDNNTGTNPILFKCNMDAGHGGQSGRFDRFKLTALKYAFVLDLVGQYE